VVKIRTYLLLFTNEIRNLFFFVGVCGENNFVNKKLFYSIIMAGFTESALVKKLEELNSSQQSIQTLSLWLIHHRKHHGLIAKVWLRELIKGTETPTSSKRFLVTICAINYVFLFILFYYIQYLVHFNYYLSVIYIASYGEMLHSVCNIFKLLFLPV
jgi:hypothetical protein